MTTLNPYLEKPEPTDPYEKAEQDMIDLDKRISQIESDPILMLEAIDEYLVLYEDGKPLLAKLLHDLYMAPAHLADRDFVAFVDMCIEKQAVRETTPEYMRRQAD